MHREKPGWSFIELPPALEQHISSIVAKFPNDIRLNPHGKPAPDHVQRIHSTFVSELSQSKKEEIESKFKAILDVTAPIEVSFAAEGMTVGEVARIKSPTCCIALGLVSPQLRALRERVAASLGGEAAVYYAGDGHISLLYAPAGKKEEVHKFIAQFGANAEEQGLGKKFLVDRVVVEWSKNRRIEYRLLGGAANK